MTNIVVLDSQAHRGLTVRAGPSVAHGDNQRFVQVIVNEFPLLVVQCPILFSKDADTGAFYCGAMLGVDPGENLLIEEGRPFEGYRPLNLQRAPFFASARGDLGIDLDSPRLGGEGGEPLFTETGAPTQFLESVMATFRELGPGLERTKVFVDTLMGLKLIESIDIRLAFDDGTSRDLEGLYSINQDALRQLPDETVVQLFRRGYLQLIYLMIASLKQIPVLAQRKNRRLLDGSASLAGFG